MTVGETVAGVLFAALMVVTAAFVLWVVWVFATEAYEIIRRPGRR